MGATWPDSYDLQWGDLHKHMTGPGADRSELDAVVGAARSHLDVVAVHCYPFRWYRKGREAAIREESVGHTLSLRSGGTTSVGPRGDTTTQASS